MSSIYNIETEIDAELAEMETNNEQRNYLNDLQRAIESRLDDIQED